METRCFYFQNGKCARDNCRFVHDMEEQAPAPVCMYYEQGRCSREDSCVFLHPDESGEADVRGFTPFKATARKAARPRAPSPGPGSDEGWSTVGGGVDAKYRADDSWIKEDAS